MTADIRIRSAEPDDAPTMVPLVVTAGGGIYEYLLDGLVPGMTAAELLLPGLAAREGSFSYRHCAVAADGDSVIGVAHAYPVDWMKMVDRSSLPADRLEHIHAFDVTQDWGSYFLSALAVVPAWRRRGIAQRLLGWAEQRARAGGFDRVTLHVWADNAPARRLYARCGYIDVGVAAIPWHPRLPHRGGSVLLCKRL
ncbi:MAG TPA: GNAT family N-acetyltransferase [Azospirillum sp.]|nr:GNAT family N-acetyltransferase [Azospirillum sp.]